MDYNQVWTNTTEKPPSTMLENSFSRAPTFSSESFYVEKNGTNSFINRPCCNSPQCSRFLKFSPEPYMPGDVNQNIRYHPYHSAFNPLERAAYRPYNTCHFYEGNGPEMEIKDYYSQVNYPQDFEMHPKIYKAQCSMAPNYLKSKLKRKRQRQLKTKKVISSTISTPRINYKNHDIAVTSNYLPSGEILTSNKTENEGIKPEAISDKNYLDGKNYFHEETKAINDTNTKTLTTNLNMASDFPNCAIKEMDLNVGNQNLSFVNNQRENFNTELLSANATANMELNNLLSMSNSDQIGYQATHIIIPDNMNSETQNIQVGSLENRGTESYSLKSIFDGKDENGQDIIILIANSEINQENNQNDITSTSVDNNKLEMQNKLAITNKLTENTMNHEDFIDFPSVTQQINQEINKESENIFFSHTDDYASEETVVTSKYLNTKKVKNKDDKSTEKKHKENVDLTAEEKFITRDFAQEASTSKQSKSIPTNKMAKIKSSHIKCNNKFFKSKPYKQWKRRFQWKTNESLNNTLHAYFRKFMKKVKLENEHMMMNDIFWGMYRIILYKVGGNVMQTMHDILPMLIKKSNLSMVKSGSTTSKLNKKRLHVKLPTTKKKLL